MSRGRLAGLAAVLVLVVAALGVRVAGSGDAAPADPADRSAAQLTALRASAGLAPCPEGVGAGLPDVTLACVGEPGSVRLAAPGDGIPTLVNVWATWCPPCVEEVPLLQALHERADGRLRVLGVLTQDTVEHALQFADDPSLGFDMTYASVVDDDGVVMRRYASGPPVTLFVTGDGEVAHVKQGVLRSAAELDTLVAEHLGVRLS